MPGPQGLLPVDPELLGRGWSIQGFNLPSVGFVGFDLLGHMSNNVGSHVQQCSLDWLAWDLKPCCVLHAIWGHPSCLHRPTPPIQAKLI